MNCEPQFRIKVAIADDHNIFRQGVKIALSPYQDIDIILEATNGANLLDQLQNVQPDVVLLDMQMPVMDGIEALRLIKARFINIRVIMLTMNNDPSLVWTLMEKGANSYLGKDSDPETIYNTIVTCFEKQFCISGIIDAARISGIP